MVWSWYQSGAARCCTGYVWTRVPDGLRRSVRYPSLSAGVWPPCRCITVGTVTPIGQRTLPGPDQEHKDGDDHRRAERYVDGEGPREPQAELDHGREGQQQAREYGPRRAAAGSPGQHEGEQQRESADPEQQPVGRVQRQRLDPAGDDTSGQDGLGEGAQRGEDGDDPQHRPRPATAGSGGGVLSGGGDGRGHVSEVRSAAPRRTSVTSPGRP